jgi:hypothetical protein
MRSPFTFDNVEYASKTACAVVLMTIGKTMSEAAKAVGITYQTLFANTKGAAARKICANKKRVVKLAKTGKYGISDLSTRTGLTKGAVEHLLKKSALKVSELQKARKNAKAAKIAAKKASKVKTPVVKDAVEPVASVNNACLLCNVNVDTTVIAS